MSDGGVVAMDPTAGRGRGEWDGKADTAGTAAGLEVPHDGREGDDSIVSGADVATGVVGKDELLTDEHVKAICDDPPAVLSEPDGFSQVGEVGEGCPACDSDSHLEPTSVVVETLPADPEPATTVRYLDSHKVNGLNEHLAIEVIDQPGHGGANHAYDITGFDTGGNPSSGRGGYRRSFSRVPIVFQNGPIAEAGANGISNEALLAIVEDRLRGFQSGPFACDENKKAWAHVRSAMQMLKLRTEQRIMRGVEGTNQI